MIRCSVRNTITANELRNGNRTDIENFLNVLLTFAFDRIVKANSEGKTEITFNFMKKLYDKWFDGVSPDERIKIHNSFVKYLRFYGFDIYDEDIFYHSSGELYDDFVTVEWWND